MDYYKWDEKEIKDLVGVTFTKVENKTNEELIFSNNDGCFVFHHCQDCCESVEIDDICGELDDLVGSPIIIAEERTYEGTEGDLENWPEGVDVPNYVECYTWTFYEFATAKGSVTVKWYGTSNGYYSESVDLVFIPKQKDTHSEPTETTDNNQKKYPKDFVKALAYNLALSPEPKGLRKFLILSGITKNTIDKCN